MTFHPISTILSGYSFPLEKPAMNNISCMCIVAEFKREGLGEFLLHTILAQAARQDYHSITLGTDIRMGAYKLDEKNNFKGMDGNILWQWRD
jgi:GNAT superfamily N-acetyltransferase